MSVISNYIAAEKKAFPSLDRLRNHINSCHMPKRFECEMCTYKSSQGGICNNTAEWSMAPQPIHLTNGITSNNSSRNVTETG